MNPHKLVIGSLAACLAIGAVVVAVHTSRPAKITLDLAKKDAEVALGRPLFSMLEWDEPMSSDLDNQLSGHFRQYVSGHMGRRVYVFAYEDGRAKCWSDPDGRTHTLGQ